MAVITGIGIVSAVGIGKEKLSAALLEGTSGIRPISFFSVPDNRNLAGTAEEFPFKRPGRVLHMLCHAMKEAIEDSKLEIQDGNNIALLLGTMAGDSRSAEELFLGLGKKQRKTPARIKASLLKYPLSSLIDNIAYRYRIQGPRMVSTNACASSNIIMGYALDLIRQGVTDTAIVCGAEALKETMFWGAEGIKILGSDLKAFDKNRNGTVLGEGAGVIVLESEAKAKKRGARIYAELAGYGISCDTHIDMIIPQADGEGFSRAISDALLDAEVSNETIHYINAHGTGTVNIDKVETLAIKRTFGDRAYTIPVSSTKTVVGHTGGAGGVIEAIATIVAMDGGFIPPTLKYETPDPELDLDYVPNTSRPGRIDGAISNNLGGGGVNSVVVMVKNREKRSRGEFRLKERVVITGIGVVAPHGLTVEQFCKNVSEKKKLVMQHEVDWASVGKDRLFMVHGFEIERLVPGKRYHLLNRAAQLVLGAALQAYHQSRLSEVDNQKVGVLVGTTFGGYTTTAQRICETLQTLGPNFITPYFLLNSGHNLGASIIAKECKLEGMYSTITTGPTAGIDVVGYGMNLIQTGRMDAMVVGAVDILDRPLFEACDTLGLLDDPRFFLSEGAGVVVMESMSSAQRRNAPILGEIKGYACKGDSVGRGKTLSESEGLRQAIKQVLVLSNLQDSEVKRIFTHGASAKETLSARQTCDLTEITGESHASVGMLSLVYALSQQVPSESFMICSSAPGGTNSVLVGEKR